MNILVTAGATREPIDDVRFLSNVSTGGTGAALAAAFRVRGHRTLLLRGEGAVAPPGFGEVETFGSAADLEARLRRRLQTGEWAMIVMAAAVADYRPAEPAAGKPDSARPELVLRLLRNPKILPRLKSFSPGPLRVVGFKLTAGAGPSARRSAVEAQFAAGGVDLVVQNDLQEIRQSEAHPFWLHRDPKADPARIEGAEALALVLEEWAREESC